MKEHLGNKLGMIACGRSGSRNQSKGVVFGQLFRDFAKVPVCDRCMRCDGIFQKLLAKKNQK